MKRLLIIIAVVLGLIIALIQIFGMLMANGMNEKLARAAFAGIILIVMAIAYQRRKRPTEKDE